MCQLSVIVPVYKTKEYLIDSVDSILNNRIDDMEIILVDDGSPDSCGKICDDYAIRHDNVKVIHKENGGLSSARNAGLDLAQGTFLAFVDSDDMVDAHMFPKMLSTIKALNADIVCCGMNILGTDIPYMDDSDWRKEYNQNECIELLISRNGTGDFYMNKVFKRELFRDIRLPVGKYYEDIFSMYKVFDKAKKVVCINEPLYLYRIHDKSISHSTDFNPKLIDYAYACRAEWEYVKTHREPYTNLAIAKYVNSINQLSKKPSIINGKSQEAKMCFNTLIELFKKDIKTIEDNNYCSDRLRLEISLMLKSKASLKVYLKKMEIYNSFHNHPCIQRRLHTIFSLADNKVKNYQY